MAVLNDEDVERRPDAERERQILLQLLNQAPKEQGGVAGNAGSLDQGLAPAAPETAVAAPQQSYAMRGFEQSKLDADPSQQSEKYKMGNIFKKYDPKGGVTPEMLAELNALGIAEFSGAGDKLTVNNTKNDPRFGSGGTADVVYGIKGQNADTAWQPWFIDDGAGAGGGAGMPSQMQAASYAGAGGGPSSIGSLVPTDTEFFQRLQAQLQEALGGPGVFDREALLKMMGA